MSKPNSRTKSDPSASIERHLPLILKAYSLPSDELYSISPLDSLANSVWLYSTPTSKLVLKRYTKQNSTNLGIRHQIESILRVQQGIAIPNILANISGETITKVDGESFELSEYIDHRPIKYPGMHISDLQIREAAKILSRVHLAPIHVLPSETPMQDQEIILLNIRSIISEFQNKLNEIILKASAGEQAKLRVLAELIHRTEDDRRSLESLVDRFRDLPIVLTHGDFSLTNLLPSSSNGKLFVIDWDNLGLRPRIWELHKSLLLICGKGLCSAYIDELNFKRAAIFLKTYQECFPLNQFEERSLPLMAHYMSSAYWLKFPLESILKGDNRAFSLLPTKVERGLWWKNNVDRYALWLSQNL